MAIPIIFAAFSNYDSEVGRGRPQSRALEQIGDLDVACLAEIRVPLTDSLEPFRRAISATSSSTSDSNSLQVEAATVGTATINRAGSWALKARTAVRMAEPVAIPSSMRITVLPHTTGSEQLPL